MDSIAAPSWGDGRDMYFYFWWNSNDAYVVTLEVDFFIFNTLIFTHRFSHELNMLQRKETMWENNRRLHIYAYFYIYSICVTRGVSVTGHKLNVQLC